MFGNLQGWLISLVIALGGGCLLWLGSRVPPVSQPSGKFPHLLGKIALPIDAKNLAPVAMTEPCDAGDHYRAAIDEFLANRAQYEKWHQNAKSALEAKPAAVERLLDATSCGRMTLFRKAPAQVVSYDAEQPAVDAIEKLGMMAVQRGMLLRKDQPAEARRYLAAAYALGLNLYEERIGWREFNVGVNLLTEAARYLAEVEDDSARAQMLKRFASEAETYKLAQFELYKTLATADSQTIGRHGGDAFALARGSPETMWRTSAILAIGRMRYNTPRKGDQLAAPRELTVWMSDPDPAVRAAAAAAMNLTIEQYRMLR